jgi:hypothetical protein
MITQLALVPIGFFLAAIFSMVGLGGGVFIVPMLVLGFKLPAQSAIGVSLATMTFTTLSATIAYARQRRINYKIGVLLDVLDVPGAVAGAYATTLIAPNWLASLFGILLIAISALMFRKRDPASLPLADGPPGRRGLHVRVVVLCLLASFASGVVAGMFGAGGGTVDESVMILALGLPAHVAAATSVFGMALTNSAAAVSHGLLGNILPEYAVPLIIGGVFGAQLGPKLSQRVQARTLRRVLAVIFVAIGLRMILLPYVAA